MKLIKQLSFCLSITFIFFVSCGTLEQRQGLKSNLIALFKDKNLEQAIREYINKPEGDIHVTDLKAIKKLDVKGKDITELEGIENCENLTFLNIAGNPIKDMSVLSKLPYLEALIIGYYNLDDNQWYANQKIDIKTLADLKNLTTLHLGLFSPRDDSMNTDDISILSNLTNLTSLQLVANNIQDISPLSKLKKLKNLVLQSNKIKDITPIAGLTDLLILSLGDNKIDDISAIENLTNLRNLCLYNNRIINIKSLSGLKNLGDYSYVLKNINDELGLAWFKKNEKDFFSLWLFNNDIDDITPLLTNYNNGGLQHFTNIYMVNNNMDLTPGSGNRNVVDTLIKAGINVGYEEGNSTVTIVYSKNSKEIGENRVKNPSFEEEADPDKPVNWTLGSWKPEGTQKELSTFSIDTSAFHEGKKSIKLTNRGSTHAWVLQGVAVEPNTTYKITAWIKTKDVGESGAGTSIGINAKMFYFGNLKGTMIEWQKVIVYAVVKDVNELKIMLSLGHYGAVNTGTVWFDDISLYRVDGVAEGSQFFEFP